METLLLKKKRELRRKLHIRRKLKENTTRPRLTVFRSHKHIYAQIIDHEGSSTLVAASTLDKDVIQQLKPKMTKVEISKVVGEAIAKRAIEKDIKDVVFDRNGFLYHGRVKALADAARKAGLQF
jgi:large subunit ribosomal protein L18